MARSKYGAKKTNIADAEQTYRQALGIEIIKLRDAKVPVTLIGDVARSNVSNLKFNRDLAEYKYKADRDKAQALQAEINALQTLYKRQEDIRSGGTVYESNDYEMYQ